MMHTATSPLRIGVAGLGNVGATTVRLLQQNAEVLAKRAGRPLVVTAVSARDENRPRDFDRAGVAWHADPVALAKDPNVDVVVEVIGGAEGKAWDVVSTALSLNKPVVSANKAMLALRGQDVMRALGASTAPLLFEAAVAGGIPVIKSLREGLAANKISAVYGILNGTCNFILSTMTATGRAFDDVLLEAKALGYAEADPTFDIDGHDAAHKLALLSALAFGGMPDVGAIKITGIRAVSALDISFARELGYRIRLLGIARRRPDGAIEQSVEACLIGQNSPLATVEGPLNAVYLNGDYVGKVLLTGAGAGGKPTASAVVADIIDIARGQGLPLLGQFGAPAATQSAPIGARLGRFFLRLQVIDQPGVIADVSAILRDCQVSLETVLQRGRDPDQEVSVILTTHETPQAKIDAAVAAIAKLASVREAPHVMRIEDLS